MRYNVCSVLRCRNPVPITQEDRHCLKHGGVTCPTWAIYHDQHGWLAGTGVGGSYSFNVDDAQWFEGTTDAVETLVALGVGLLAISFDEIARWRRIGPFTIMLIK